MGRYEQQPKPYDFVTIDELKDSDRCHPSWHDRYHPGSLSGILRCEIRAVSPIHVASGKMELTSKERVPLVKTHTKCNERAIIPGSSLKGCIRSIVEAISASCVSITRAYYNQLPGKTARCNNKENLCVACRMFGSMGYLGKVRFSDAVLQDGFRTTTASIPQLYSSRDRENVYLNKDRKVKGRKFYQHGNPASGGTPIEVCPVNSKLSFTVSFDNLTKAELGLLLIAMGQGEPKFNPKLGGAKPVCYGTVEISITGSELIEDIKSAYLQFDAKPGSANIFECVAAAKAEKLILDRQLNQLEKILKLDQKRQCPSGNY